MKTCNQNRVSRVTRGVCVALAIVVLVPAVLADVPGKIITKKGEVTGVIRYQPASKVFSVQAGNVVTKIPLADVVRVIVKKPAELDAAVAAAQRGQAATAMPILEKVMTDYQMMEWDIVAARWLMACYLVKNESVKAEEMGDKVIAANGGNIPSGDFFSVYVETLIANKKEAKARKILQDAIASGDRMTAALAQIKRGDLDQKKGDSKAALVDGYLRTVILFADIKEVQPEALYNAVKCFEQLQQASYADKFRKRLLAEFPKDPYTAKLQSGK